MDNKDLTASSSDEVGKKRKEKKPKQLTLNEDSFLASLIACDPQTELAPAVKPIFEQKKEKEIIGNLSLFIKSRESDIEKLCQQNFAVCPLTHTDSYY